MQKTIITKIDKDNIDRDTVEHDSKVNKFCEGKKIFGTLTSLVSGHDGSGVLYKSDTICYEGAQMINKPSVGNVTQQTYPKPNTEIRDTSVSMVPCPKCGDPIHPKFTYHAKCGWKKGQPQPPQQPKKPIKTMNSDEIPEEDIVM